MSKYLIEVDAEVDKVLNENAAARGASAEQIISELIHTYLIPAHIMQLEDEWKKGYSECGEINLEWANLK